MKKQKNLCDNCKKELEEQKVKFWRPLLSWCFLIIIFSLMLILIVLTTKGSEILSLGERIILLILAGSFSFTFFIPLFSEGLKDLTRNYELIKSTRLYKLKYLCWLPYLLITLWFFINLVYELYSNLLYELSVYLFLILLFIPQLVTLWLSKKRGKKK